MTASIQSIHPVLAAHDVTASIDFFRRLGFHLSFQDHAAEPKYAAVQRDGIELHIQWADPDQWAYPVDRPAYRFTVSNVDDLYAEFLASGGIRDAESRSSPWAIPANTPWGTREFHLRDPGRNNLQFYRPI